MFDKTVFRLSTISAIDSEGAWGDFVLEELAARKKSDYLIARNKDGGKFELRKCHPNKVHLILSSIQDINGTRTENVMILCDELIAQRIITYKQEFFDKKRTNCSTLAEYLRTGVFQECDPDRSSFMFSGGVNHYTGQKIRSGDTLCVLYFPKWVDSRYFTGKAARTHYRRVRGMRGDLSKLKGERFHLSPENLLESCCSGPYSDYHFMFCIAIRNGQPIFIQQLGLNRPNEREKGKAPIVITVGMIDVTGEHAPAHVFLKRA